MIMARPLANSNYSADMVFEKTDGKIQFWEGIGRLEFDVV